MASIFLKDGVYVARFRHGGVEHKRSLKTGDRRDAELALAEITRVIHRLRVGLMAVPAGVAVPDFVLSGGTLAAPPEPGPEPPPVPTVAEACAQYRDNLAHLAPTTRMTVGVHLRNFQGGIGRLVGSPVSAVREADLKAYIQGRLGVRARDTVKKERSTLVAFFDWCASQGFVPASPAAALVRVKGAGDPPRFQTLAEIEAVIARGGLARAEEGALWDRLYLTPGEIGEILELARTRSRHGVSHVLHAIPAYTGMRRGEILRLRWDDVEFEHDGIVARSKKQSRQADETARRIDLHPALKAILRDWQGKRPKGQFVACDDGVLDPLERHQAEERFWQPLKGTRWVIPERNNRPKIGFHTYRHSFASNLAAAGVDQRVIDEFMGHTTEAMRKRYRHLFPKAKRSAIETLAFGVPADTGPAAV